MTETHAGFYIAPTSSYDNNIWSHSVTLVEWTIYLSIYSFIYLSILPRCRERAVSSFILVSSSETPLGHVWHRFRWNSDSSHAVRVSNGSEIRCRSDEINAVVRSHKVPNQVCGIDEKGYNKLCVTRTAGFRNKVRVMRKFNLRSHNQLRFSVGESIPRSAVQVYDSSRYTEPWYAECTVYTLVQCSPSFSWCLRKNVVG